ncbi:MAG TPA: hypothetical protein VLG45_12275 [Thermodesulfobacteriota bacterium]|nr:hypothetical protein [Thermodesulfobacteriota bacterium]
MTKKDICKALVIGAFALGACAAQNETAQQDDGFDMSICNNIPVGIEAYEAMDPASKQDKISCADLERCASYMGNDTPPNVPCEGP